MQMAKMFSSDLEPMKHPLENSDNLAKKSPIITGYECEFVDQLPKRSECPICLLVLREPHQATCCGKIFCKACICKIRDKEQPCPTCKTESFACYPDKGLQQELYSFRVYCPRKIQGCDWEGELGGLDQHLNLDPEESTKMDGCGFVGVDCFYCSGLYPRCELGQHQSTECVKRPFTCATCLEYKSTYDDVVFVHLSTCKCRPVDCPNRCGDVVQHQELEEHLSSHCELSEVECEFSHAGCEVMMPRKDLSSHLNNNLVTHMSLLAAENRRLKLELQRENEDLREMERRLITLEKENRKLSNCISCLPPFFIRYPWTKFVQRSRWQAKVVDYSEWFSEPFYSHLGGYKLRLKVWCMEYPGSAFRGIFLSYQCMSSRDELEPSCMLYIATSVQDFDSGTFYLRKKLKCSSTESEILKVQGFKYTKLFVKMASDDDITFHIDHVEVVRSSSEESSSAAGTNST